MLGISICNGRFDFGKRIGKGSFGSVYYGVDTKTSNDVAIKLESISCKTPQLEYEAKLYKVLSGGKGFPAMHWYGQEAGCNIMVLDLLGPSLQDLLTFVGRRFSLKTVVQLGQKVLNILEYLHSYSFIHRDLKPANLLVGHGEMNTEVHLVDLGLAKRYWSSKTGSHIPYRQKSSRGIIGSARYASVNAHHGIELSRRDDIESCVYMLIQFMRGTLPWQNLVSKSDSKEDKNQRIGLMKAEMRYEHLCEGLPSVFPTMLMLTHCMEFEEQPNYQGFHRLLKVTAAREGLECDGEFDWVQLRVDGGVVEHVEEDDRISCNLSQVSMDSAQAQDPGLGVGTGSWSNSWADTASEGKPSAGPSGRAGSRSAANSQGGPLLRSVKKTGIYDPSLLRAMQSAGVSSGPLWQSMKQLVVTDEDAAEEQHDGAGGQT